MAKRNIELYEALRGSLSDEAARMIAEVVPSAEDLATKSFVHEEVADLRAEMHREFSQIKGRMVGMMLPLWLGVYGTLITLVVLVVRN